MSQFFFSCKESRIESNRSFYGCFYLGPLEPSQSITIANALRRTLLSELYGLGIISAEIEGATHEYSSLPGVRDSVLDILLNLKEIVLKKTMKNFKPQVGYLRARGPGVVRASHLRLPPFIQCVDPDQYIATLADNGFLNLKITIQYGNKWMSPQNSWFLSKDQKQIKTLTPPFFPKGGYKKEGSEAKSGWGGVGGELGSQPIPAPASQSGATNPTWLLRPLPPSTKREGVNTANLTHLYAPSTDPQELKEQSKNASAFNLHLKKRRLILKKLKHISFLNNFAVDQLAQSCFFLSKYTKKRKISPRLLLPLLEGSAIEQKGLRLNVGIPISKKYPPVNLKKNRRLSKSIEKNNLDPLTKKSNFNSVSETELKTRRNSSASYSADQTKNQKHSDSEKVIGRKRLIRLSGVDLNKKMIFINANPLTIDAVFNPINKVNYIIEMNDFKTAPSKMKTSFETSELNEILQNIQPTKQFLSIDHIEKDLKDYMQSQLISEQQNPPLLQQFSNAGEGSKLDNILEIQREINALKKDTIKHNITLEIWTNGSIHPRDALYQGFQHLIKLFSKLKKINSFGEFSLNSLSELQKNKKRNEKTLTKKIKMGEITSTLLQDLLPLNQTSFLSTYVSPKLKNYYLNNQSLSLILNNPVITRPTETNFINNRLAGDLDSNQIRISNKNTEKLSLPSFSPLLTSNFVGRRRELAPSFLFRGVSEDAEIKTADIGILNLSLRSYTSLKRLNIHTVEELVEFYTKDLTKFQKLGKILVKEIEKSFKKIGL